MIRRKLIVINGDDFGYSEEVNRGIAQAHEQGVLTSASLMVTGAEFAQAVEIAKAHPQLAVGLHLVLICGQAVLSPQEIPHLVNEQGNFPDSTLTAWLRYQFDRAARRELRLEIAAQLEKFRATGLQLSHVDGHLHLHCHPVVLSIICELAEEFNIKVIRLPSEELKINLRLNRQHLLTKLLHSGVFTWLRSYGERQLQSAGIKFAERVYGLLATGNMTEAYLLGLIPQIKADLVEVYAHPASHLISRAESPQSQSLNNLEIPMASSAQAELDALLSERVRALLVSNQFELTNYNQIGETVSP